jgi:hypothetical protein
MARCGRPPEAQRGSGMMEYKGYVGVFEFDEDLEKAVSKD